MALKNRIEVNKFFIALLLSFIIIQIGSYLLSEFFGYPLFKGGPILLLFLVVIVIVSLFTLGRKLGELDLKRDGLFILLVLGGIIALFILLPYIIPQIFSASSMEIREFFRRNIATAVEMGPRGIAYQIFGE